MDRKLFIKQTCGICLAVSTGLVSQLLSSCATSNVLKSEVINNTVIVPLNLFAIATFQLVRPHGYEYDIAVRKLVDGNYSCLLLKCTHADNQLHSLGNGYTCNLHGSVFSNEGVVEKGPATSSLQKVPFAIEKENIIITLI